MPVCGGDHYRVDLDGELVLYRAFTGVYPPSGRLEIVKVGMVMNREWGRDAGSRFLAFPAARGAGR